MSKRNLSWRVAGAAALLAAASLSARAHHSAAMFDPSKHIIFHGTVAKWLWTNPHTWLYLRVEKKDGTQEVWAFEAGGTNMLISAGWNAADIKSGDKVIVTAQPERAGHHFAEIEQVRLSDGRLLTGGGPPASIPGGPGPTGPASSPIPYQ